METASDIQVIKSKKTMFLVVPRSDVHFSIENKFFCVPDWARRQNQAPRKKFAIPEVFV